MIQIDMPMPTNCLDCPACNEYLTCAIPVKGRKWGENDVREFGQSRPEWCPMKEQPQEGCKWCSRKPVFSGSYCLNGDNEEALADGDWTILYMGCDEVGRIRLTACGDGRADYYPKFCPECGKPVNRN